MLRVLPRLATLFYRLFSSSLAGRLFAMRPRNTAAATVV
jgi:hypothetical protein